MHNAEYKLEVVYTVIAKTVDIMIANACLKELSAFYNVCTVFPMG